MSSSKNSSKFKIYLSSIKTKLLLMVASVLIVITVTIIYFSTAKSKELGFDILIRDSNFITKLLSDNLAFGLESMILDNGDTLRKALDMVKPSPEDKDPLIKDVFVFDKSMVFVMGMNNVKYSGKEPKAVEKMEIFDKNKEMHVLNVLVDSSNMTVGYVLIIYSKNFFLQKTTDFANKSMLLGIIIFFISLIATIIFGNRLINPLKSTVAMLKDISEGEGDLTKRINVDTNDEIGNLVKYFNNFIQNLQDLVKEIGTMTYNTLEGVDQINNGNRSLSEKIQEQAAAIEHTASTMEEISATIKESENQSLRTVKISSELEALAKQGHSILQTSIKKAQEVKESSKKIEEVLDLVNEISFQINLLSLNAAVEAARAGEAGKGFAVVATEVRNLANRTGEAAKDIQALIKNSNIKVDESNEEAIRSGEMFGKIANKISEVVTMIKSLSEFQAQQAQGIDLINKNISHLDTNIQNNAALVEELASNSDRIASESNALNILISKFKV